jgi:hypothetical protein
MTNRPAKFIAIVLVGFAISVAMTAVTGGAARAEECLAGPKGTAPKGSHWYYRVDRPTKRNCWYIREVGQKPAQLSANASAQPSDSASAQPDRAQPAVPLQPSVANAFAEFSPTTDRRNLAAAQPAGAAAPASVLDSTPNSDSPAGGSQRWSLAARWSDLGQAGSTDQPASDATANRTTVAPDEMSALTTNSSAPTAPPVQSTVRSIWMLLGALVGALALAGALVGAVVKFGRSKPKIHRDINGRPDIWGQAISEARLPESNAFAEHEVEHPEPPMNWIKIARDRHTALNQSDEIEQLLARAPRRPA